MENPLPCLIWVPLTVNSIHLLFLQVTFMEALLVTDIGFPGEQARGEESESPGPQELTVRWEGPTGGATSRELGLDGEEWSALGARARGPIIGRLHREGHPGLAAFLGVWGGEGQHGAHLREGPGIVGLLGLS